MSRTGWLVVALVVVMAAFGLRQVLQALPDLQVTWAESQSATPTVIPPGSHFHPFPRAQVQAFLTKARQADAIADPLQRCLAYPDPPGSHWNAAAVKAYCRYRNLPIITFDQMRQLIESGHAAELDQRLADALQKQQTDPASQGLLDHIYLSAFHTGSFDIRPTLDAWKRQSPDSAFAYAASGLAYRTMAFDARGAAYIRDTPDSAIVSMERLAREADDDLRHALAIDPRVTPIYPSLMDVGRMGAGRDYGDRAWRAGLKVAPANFYLHTAAILQAMPKWGGSIGELEDVRRHALAHAAENPLLYLAATDAELEKFNFEACRCNTPPEMALMQHTLQDIAPYSRIRYAAEVADAANQRGLAAVYFTEAYRFSNLPMDRLGRAFQLVHLGHPRWARDEMNVVAPGMESLGVLHRGLGFADMALKDNANAIDELAEAVRLDASDAWSRKSLGRLYVETQQWDNAWYVANQLIQREPDAPDGWRLRADVQMGQPRAGLADTEQDFVKRFGNRPDQQGELHRIRDALAHGTH